MSMLAQLFVKEILSGNKAMEDVPKGLQKLVKEALPDEKKEVDNG